MSEEPRWLAEHRVAGVLHGRIGRARDRLVAEWCGVGRLEASRDGADARFVAEPGASPVEVDKVRRGSAALLLRHLEGHLGLHGAAVAMRGLAVGLVGPAEAGKSTLAAALCTAHGAELLADDAIALESGPSGDAILRLEREHWLDGGSRRALGLDTSGEPVKRPARAAACGTERAPLAALVHLAFDEVSQPELALLEGVDALACLLEQALRFVIDEPEAQRRELDSFVALIGRVPVFRLTRPRSFEFLPAGVALVAEVVKSR